MYSFLIRKPAANNDSNELSSESGDESCGATKNPKRNFRTVWLDEFAWLRNRDGCGFCVACDKKLNNHVSYLRIHGSLRIHILNVERKKNQIKINTFGNPQKVSKFIMRNSH